MLPSDHILEDVSRETMEQLQIYMGLLRKWQSKINLVSPQTLDEAWSRHFVDSAQVNHLLSKGEKTIFDFGSGAGFPGLVLAIMNPDKQFVLVESDQKKCSFMKTVSRETELNNVTIENARIEDVSRETIPDVIMARALASLDKLLDYASDWIEINPNLRLIFPKGERFDEEVTQAFQSWVFEIETVPSQTDPNASVLILTNVERSS